MEHLFIGIITGIGVVLLGLCYWVHRIDEKYPTTKPASHVDCERCKYEERIERTTTH
jgi:hypothetical protein